MKARPFRTALTPEECRQLGVDTVLAYDPGGTTGWSVMQVRAAEAWRPGGSVMKALVGWDHGQIRGPEDRQVDEILRIAAGLPDAAVVCESFQIRQFNQNPAFLSPVRLRSVLEHALRRGECGEREAGVRSPRRLFTQTPAQALGSVTDARLKAWRCYVREGGEVHARDADRHALTFLRRAKDRSALRREAGWVPEGARSWGAMGSPSA